MRISNLIESLLSSKQDCVVLPPPPIDPQYPSTSTASTATAANTTTTTTATTATSFPFASTRTSKAYRQLKRDCLRRGQLFVDLDFPPTNESLFLDESSLNGQNLDIQWKRPGEIVDNPKLFVEGASPFDVTQGILGNCWFVSACSALTHNEALLQKVIPDPQGQEWAHGNDYAGIFQFSFWRFGRWVDVLIDDLLPCKEGKLLFARSKTPNEFWSALLEKAFAKLYGCYENLVGGQLADALQDVSGGVAESLNVRKFLRLHSPVPSAASTAASNGGPATKLMANGRAAAHPPSPAGFRGLRIFSGILHSSAVSPVGHSSALSLNPLMPMDGSRRLFYTLKHAFDREALIVAAIAANRKEEVERTLDCGLVMGHAYALTAIRYIELDANRDWQQPDRGEQPLGKRQAMVRLQNPWGEKEWNGPWSDGSEEWEQVTAEQKRRLGITVDEDGEFWMPWEEFVHYFTDISVCQLLNTQSVDPSLKRRMSIKASRRSNATIGMPERQFREWTFFGRWSSNGVKSGAPRDRAGGCLNFPATFCSNPQFLLDMPGPGSGEVMIALSQKDQFIGGQHAGTGGGGGKEEKCWKRRGLKQRQPYLVVGLHLMRVETNRRHRIHQAINPVATSEYSSGRSIFLHLAELPPGRYCLIPSTYAPREEAEFMLRIYSTNSQLNPRPLEEDPPPHLAGCAAIRRARFVTRLRIVQAEMAPNAQESDIFCRVVANMGGGAVRAKERVRTAPMLAEPGHSVHFNECFIFHGHSPVQKFTMELLEQRKPFGRRNKSLGRAKVRIRGDQNDCKQMDLEMMGEEEGKVDNKGMRNIAINGDQKSAENGKTEEKANGGGGGWKLRVEICSYDDPLYL